MIEVYVLSILLIASNAFWAYLTHKLLNKVMSRTFWEYQQAKVIPKSEAQALRDALKDVKVPEDKGPNEIDSLDEMIKTVIPF